jgi:integrase
MRAYAVYLLRLRRIEFSVHTRLAWHLADDTFLRLWRDYLVKKRRIKKSTFNAYLSTVLGFYKHAQGMGWARGLIGVNDFAKGEFYRIAMHIETRDDGREVEFSPLRIKTTEEPEPYFPPKRVIDEITASIAISKRPALAERDLLIVEWLRRCGLRRREALWLTRSLIPTLEEIDAFEDALVGGASDNDDDHVPLTGYPIKITSAKSGGRPDMIFVQPELLRRTRRWLDGGRREILGLKRGPHRDPSEIFISAKTGTVLIPQSVTNLFKTAACHAQKAAKEQGERDPQHSLAHPHNLRAEAITDQLVGRLDAGMEQTTALFETQVFARLASREVMEKHYLKLAQRMLENNKAAARDWSDKSNTDVKERAEIDHQSIQLGAEHLRRAQGIERILEDMSPHNVNLVARLLRMLAEGLITEDRVKSLLGNA